MAIGLPQPLSAARKTGQMVGREKVLADIYKAIYAPGQALRVVFVRAEGGYGKTRLLEEVLWRAGHPRWRAKRPMTDREQLEGLDWSAPDKVAISDLIDLIDTTLQERDRFVRELHDSFHWSEPIDPSVWRPIDTASYNAGYDKLRRLRVLGAPLKQVREAADAATDAFLDDLMRETNARRVVLALDTVEQLSYITSNWLMDRQLLKPEDLSGRTHQWLENVLLNGYEGQPLQNVTLLLFGRGEEGQSFFESIEAAVTAGRKKRYQYDSVLNHSLISFNEQETQQYFAHLAADWKKRGMIETLPDNDPAQLGADWISEHFDYIAQAKQQTPFQDTYRVLHLLTGGVPVRLALYAQLIVEGRRVPEPLSWNYEEAQQAVREQGRETIQWQIEDQFIWLLFQQQSDLRGQILLILARTPRGLNAEQLCFILYADPNAKPESWEPDPQRLGKITKTLEEMVDLYLVKRRASWSHLAKLRGNGKERDKSIGLRLGLQDEIYRIYAEHMAPFQPPVTAMVQRIEEYLKASEDDFASRFQGEQKERKELYSQLQKWATAQLADLRHLKQQELKKDEAQFEAQLRANDPRTFSFHELKDAEIERRDQLQVAINNFQIEEMIYALVRRPDYNFNRDYTDVGYSKYLANEEGSDFASQVAAWQIINDRYGVYLKFAEFRERPDADKRTAVEVLRQALVQEDVSRWLKRFVIWGDYRRAPEFAEGVEGEIGRLPADSETDQRTRYTWNHPLSKGELTLWTAYAQIMTAQDIRRVNDSVRETLAQLEQLYNATVKEQVFVQDGIPILGFKGVPDEGIAEHPARNRIRRLLSYGYNILGYGNVSIGRFHDAITYYGQALHYLRGDKGADAHRATVLNNLSRALSELGEDSTAVCLDGLRLRFQEATEIPIALSYNTLALIYDRLREPTRAWDDAAKAVAYFRRAEDWRGLGLALLQLAGAMRHLAGQARSGETAIEQPGRLCDTSEGLLRQALDLFRSLNEPVRTIEVLTEFGNLNRDRLLSVLDPISSREQQDYYDRAMGYYNDAIYLATGRNLLKYVVDVQVNMAWLHFYKRENTAMEHALERAEAIISESYGDGYFITPDNLPQAVNLDDPWILPQLSKAHSLRGHVAIEGFKAIDAEYKAEYPDDDEIRRQKMGEDQTAERFLATTAEEYMLAIGYAERFSPRSMTISHILSNLYNDIKAFNPTELEDFHDQTVVAERKYKKLKGAAVLGPYIHAYFGLPPCAAGHRNELNGSNGANYHE